MMIYTGIQKVTGTPAIAYCISHKAWVGFVGEAKPLQRLVERSAVSEPYQ
ncbi:MAG TPA: hypothetical protein VIR03_03545 [Candidatus Saccharimonadales bacterium]